MAYEDDQQGAMEEGEQGESEEVEEEAEVGGGGDFMGNIAKRSKIAAASSSMCT
jgi:hypothetical protein